MNPPPSLLESAVEMSKLECGVVFLAGAQPAELAERQAELRLGIELAKTEHRKQNAERSAKQAPHSVDPTREIEQVKTENMTENWRLHNEEHVLELKLKQDAETHAENLEQKRRANE